VNSPPKEKRGVGTALQNAQLFSKYHALAFLANLFAAPFWFFEQRRGQLTDRINNERSAK
jgi:hypothetical protein